ncbi:hypothetical protein [Actinocorallia sp. A-T 12471]|uniref:hypothetical protein n=1 Tax=Actinocorallia sp. A-T 12471 TaxID=3089813 RepID=UPI0029CC651C|nr:hypothetical protein [Actinocorallia sp. A-T 12471]MDX6743735.1 hypothetical protein [Actinocorallia sp. A-T 12471]
MSEHEAPSKGAGPSFADAMWSVPSYILSGMIIWGGAGWFATYLTGWVLFKPIGLVIGVVLAVYLVYVKYGR